jgi:hypothetical protein
LLLPPALMMSFVPSWRVLGVNGSMGKSLGEPKEPIIWLWGGSV